MGRNKIEESDYRSIAEETGLDAADVKRAVQSFFAIILRDAKKLPFNTWKKIYQKDKFNEIAAVRNIPYLGRLGPVYSRYLKWRANEARELNQVPRSSYRSRLSQSEIENMAADILSGKTPSPIKKKKGSEMYSRVWMVGKDGRRQARQVIPKDTEDGI